MEKRVMANWIKRLKQRRPGTSNWFLEGVLGWVELNYVELLSALPPYVSRFLADTVPQEWHYTLAEPRAHVQQQEEVEMTPEQKANEEARLAREAARQAAAEEEKARYAAERRAAAEAGLEGPAFRQKSKKEIEEERARKRGQGNRTAKAGPRRRKYDPDAKGLFEE
mmetsp:Transcript_14457/g.25284  ORF Transcript_14457/g.25284 Transcript_14457/m.25284 type:complete len:167 (+) Transcript_14457:119-619(+)